MKSLSVAFQEKINGATRLRSISRADPSFNRRHQPTPFDPSVNSRRQKSVTRFCLTTTTRRSSQRRLPVTRKRIPTKRPRGRFTRRHTNLCLVAHLQRTYLQAAVTIRNSSSRVATAGLNWAREPSRLLLLFRLLAHPFPSAPNFQQSRSAHHPNKTDRDLRIRLLDASGGLPPLYLKVQISAPKQRTTPLHQILLAPKPQTPPANFLAASSPPRI